MQMRTALLKDGSTEMCPDMPASHLAVHTDLYKLFQVFCLEESVAPVSGSLGEIAHRLELALQPTEPRGEAGTFVAGTFVTKEPSFVAYIKHLTWDLCFTPGEYTSWCVSGAASIAVQTAR